MYEQRSKLQRACLLLGIANGAVALVFAFLLYVVTFFTLFDLMQRFTQLDRANVINTLR